MTDPAHLNTYRDAAGYYFIEVVQGADRITITPPMASNIEAGQALKQIRAATGLPIRKVSA